MIVFALRHADRQLEPADALKVPEGETRAELLGQMLAESGVSIAFCSTARRAQDTLKPLKRRLGAKLAIELVDGANQPHSHVKTIVEAIRKLPPDTTVAVVGHSDTTELLVEELTRQPVDPIAGQEFDKLFVVFIDPTGAATLLRGRYGEST